MLREAWALWASGAASAEAIDAVVRNSFGRRLGVTGPLESADVGGLDTMYHFGRSLMPDLETPPLARQRGSRRIGEGPAPRPANGRGVYDWSKRDGAALLPPAVPNSSVGSLPTGLPNPEVVQCRGRRAASSLRILLKRPTGGGQLRPAPPLHRRFQHAPTWR